MVPQFRKSGLELCSPQETARTLGWLGASSETVALGSASSLSKGQPEAHAQAASGHTFVPVASLQFAGSPGE